MSEDGLRIRLLGDLQLQLHSRPLQLPPSKKTRALLAYLVTTGRPQLRERLCDLLWEGPDDPRGALRWSLAKLRPLLDVGARCLLVADRERVAFVQDGADVDVSRLAKLGAGGVGTAAIDDLRDAAALFGGEFAEGLDLPACSRFHEWCVAEREKWAELRLSVLARLVDLLADSPEEALIHARSRVSIDPLNESSHLAVIRLLATLGRHREALRQYDFCRQLLEAELGARPGAALERARATLKASSAARAADEETRTTKPTAAVRISDPVIVGRSEERAILDAVVAAASAAGASAKFLLLVGDPGIGKTCLLRYLGDAVVRAGGEVLAGRAFEAEMIRPYGIWADILARFSRQALPDATRAGLRPLLADGIEAAPNEGDRTRLFTAMVSLIAELSDRSPVGILIDDLQWVDDASVSLLHYVTRAFEGTCRVVVAATARPGELADNGIAQRLVQGLARETRLIELPLRPLDEKTTAALARTVAPDLNVASVVATSEGNPLFTLELARSLARGNATLPGSIGSALAEHLARPEGPARAILPWAAALGRVFDVGVLARCVKLTPSAWLEALEELERRGIIRGVGEERYDFAHDLIRSAAYGQISQPRRRLIHGQIAQALADALDANAGAGVLGGELARHAVLGGNDTLAARGFALAGEHSLCVFAHNDAIDFAERGMRHLARVATGAQRTRLQIALLRIQIIASGGNRQPHRGDLLDNLAAVVNVAETSGLASDATTGYYLLSELHYEDGDAAAAASNSLRAAEIGRGADPATAAVQLANTACCLLMLEQDVSRSRALIAEAGAMSDRSDRKSLWLLHGQALLRRWDGELDAAVPLLEQARTLAHRLEDRWEECRCLVWLTMIHLERSDSRASLACVDELLPLASKMGEGGELPFGRVLQALVQARLGQAGAQGRLESALDELRSFDSKARLAYALNAVGELTLADGRFDRVREVAQEALAAARATRRVCEAVRAQALLSCVLAAQGEHSAARACLEPVLEHLGNRDALSEGARQVALRAAAELGLCVQTLVQTPRPQDHT
jgi:DNA-binding SARP family transcriptional activator/tetratricopeptide (TPR) repeat protein